MSAAIEAWGVWYFSAIAIGLAADVAILLWLYFKVFGRIGRK